MKKRILSCILILCMVITLISSLTVTVFAETEGDYTYTVTDGKATITDFNSSVSGSIIIPNSLGGYPVTSIGDSAFWFCKSLTSISIPESVTSIDNSAFTYCSSLTSISIPQRVTSIGIGAFSQCNSLTSISIPKGVISIDDYTFNNCNSLTSISIPQGVTSIGNYAFNGCISLTSISIPQGVTSIDYGAFNNCSNLTSISIPQGVTFIGDNAFSNCNTLRDVYYTGTEEEWNKISIDSSNSELINATKHYSTTGGGGGGGGGSSYEEGTPVITSAKITTGTGTYDLFSQKLNIEKDSDLYADIEISVNTDGCKNVKTYITQGASKAVEIPLGACKSIQIGKKFVDSKDIYIFAVDSDTGKSSSKVTKLRVTSSASGELLPGGTTGLNFKLGKNVGFTIPDSVPVFGNMDIGFDLDFIPITFEYENNNKMNIAFGLSDANIDETTGKFKGFSFKDYKEEIKSATKKSISEYKGAVSNNSINKKMQKKYPDMKFDKVKFNVSSGINPSANVSGYAEMVKTENGWIFSEGQLMLEAEVKYSYQGQIFIWVVPCYYEFGGGVGAGVEGTMTNISPINFEPQFNAYLSAKIMAEVGGGIGIAKVATVGASGEGSLNIKTAINKNYLKSWGEGSADFKVKVFGKTVASKNIAKGDFLIYETGSNKGLIKDNAINLMSAKNEYYSDYNIDTVYENENREYAAAPTSWISEKEKISLKSAGYINKDLTKLANNIYTESKPIISEIDGKKVMVMLWDNESRADSDRTMLVYSVYDDTSETWLPPITVDDDGTADFYPDFKNGMLVWQNEKSQLSDDMTLREIGEKAEICAAKWNGNSFDKLPAVTDNNIIDTQPSATGESVVWTTNSENDILGISGTNTIMRSDFDGTSWCEPYEVKSGLNAVTNLESGVVDNKLVVAYVCDDDNDMNTIDDRDIRIIADGTETQLTKNSVLDSNPVFADNLIYYYSEGNIKYSDISGNDVQSVFAESKPGLTDSFVADKNDNGDTAIWWTKTKDGATNVYTVLNQNGEWSDEIQVTELTENNKAKYPSGLLNQDGTMLLAFNNGILENNEIIKTDLYTLSVNPSYDIEISNVEADETLMKIYATVSNKGELAINNYSVNINDNGINNTYTSSETLKAGESKNIELQYNMPTDMSGRTVTLEAIIEDGEEYKTDNNTAELTIGLADISVENVTATENDMYTISADISNIGYTSVNDVTVTLRSKSVDGEIIAEKTISSATGESKNVSFDIDPKSLKYESSQQQLYITTQTTDEESNLGNNDAYVYVNSPYGSTDYSVEILNYSSDTDKVFVNSVSVNNTDAEINATAYTAAYDEKGRFIALNSENINVLSNDEITIDSSFNIAENDIKTIKTFILADKKPIVKNAEYEIAAE